MRMRYAYVRHHPPERQSLMNARLTVSGSYTKLLLIFFLQKRIDSTQEAFIHPRSRVMHVLIRINLLYLTSFGLLNKNTCPCHFKACKSKDNFFI